MSSWCPEVSSLPLRRAGTTYLFAAVLCVAGASADAAEFYFQPRADVSVDVNSNRDLVSTGPTTTSEGYTAEAGGTWDIDTPRSDTVIRPQLGYYDDPRLNENALVGIVDLSSDYRFDRGSFNLAGQFDHRATFQSELAAPNFNPVNPDLPTAPETGRINTTTTRTLTTLAPSFLFDFTPRLSWRVSGIYQDVNYGGSNSNEYVSYSYYQGATSFGWVVAPRLETSLGVYGSRESAKDGSGSVDGGGVELAVDYRVTQQFRGRLEVFGEHDDSTTIEPISVKETTNGEGGTVSGTWTGEISTVMLSVGRIFTPTGAGGRFAADHLQIEYHRELSPRLIFSTAGVYNRFAAVSTVYSGSNYNYFNATASLKWLLTRTLYVSGGAAYIWDEFEAPVGSAHNDMLYISFGYEGLKKPQ